jgi:23S rRNA pseudouridine955/2504/2580 synthase
LQEIIIDEKNESKKLFRFIKSLLPGLKNNEIFKLLRKKIITINNKKAAHDYLLQNGDVIKVFLKDNHFNIKGKKNKFSSVNKKIDVIFEDENILVVNKKSGLLSHPDNNNYKDNLYERVRSYLYSKDEYDPKNPFSPALCNRLDRNTSGLLIIAKNHLSLQKITTQFRERKALKKYLLIVTGCIKNRILIKSIINAIKDKVEVINPEYIKKIPDKLAFLNKNPEFSASLIKPLKYNENYSLIEVDLWTGKKHQIRAHLNAFGHPLIGDKKYFSKLSLKNSADLQIKQFFLHSYKLKIENYPEFTADPPNYFTNMISKIF